MNSDRPKLVIIGIGNDIMGDDAVGLRAARILRDEFKMAEVIESFSLGLDLLDLIEGHTCALLLDSMVTYTYVSGTIMELNEGDIRLHGRVSPHYAGVAETMEMARILQVPLPEHLAILAMEVSDPFHFHVGLTPAVEEALPEFVERARQILTRWMCRPQPDTKPTVILA